MWGKIKNNGDDWMYPKPMMDLSQDFIDYPLQRLKRWIYSRECIVACGLSHSMVIVDRTDIADRLEQLEIYDGKGSLEESVEPKEEAVATTKQKPAKRGASKKRKASKASSDSDEENSDKEKEAQGSDSDYSDDDGEEEANGKKQRTRGRGRGRGGRTGNGKASPVEEDVDLASLRNHSDSKK
ncbi:histone deacetylase HDT2-like isoform X2 [Brassica rapa]|uniref:histone deacetylase HDT2-like isoform X2 n=1 Tax=Brassica campestris TaxID=3711 RepID=UPI00142E2A17|nr:histone deacetylase HDT2-like isoform X2 [Brassica rapa]